MSSSGGFFDLTVDSPPLATAKRNKSSGVTESDSDNRQTYIHPTQLTAAMGSEGPRHSNSTVDLSQVLPTSVRSSSVQPAHNLGASSRHLPSNVSQSHAAQPQMNAAYLNAPQQQNPRQLQNQIIQPPFRHLRTPQSQQEQSDHYQVQHNQYLLQQQQYQQQHPYQQQQLQQQRQHQLLQQQQQQQASRVLPSNISGLSADALQAHLNKVKAFQNQYGRPGDKYQPPAPLAPSYTQSYNYNPNATIVFSLANTREFTAKAEGGSLPSATLQTLKNVAGVRFDDEKKRLLFPLSEHDKLQVALALLRITVDPLPRAVIAAAQLSYQRYNSSHVIDVDGDDEAKNNNAIKEEETLKALKGKIHDKLLNSLAPFQREGVLFVMNNKGRALIADEMGLGKTRSAIAISVAYQSEWPCLVVSPSSARRHWQAEILSLISPECVTADDICLVESSSQEILQKKNRKNSNSEDNNNNQSSSYKYVIISYALVPLMLKQLESIDFKVIIADECHYLKNSKAARTQGLVKLLKQVSIYTTHIFNKECLIKYFIYRHFYIFIVVLCLCIIEISYILHHYVSTDFDKTDATVHEYNNMDTIMRILICE